MRDVWRGIPAAGKAVALVTLLIATAWALIIPPYQVPDETVHVAYAQHLAETGKPPSHQQGAPFSSEQAAELEGLLFFSVIGNRNDKPPWSRVQQESLERLTRDKPRDNGGHWTVATNNPPLYYAVAAVAYHAVPGASTLTRLYAMRLVSALMAAATALLIFMFLRELFPATPFAWTVGGLAVAFQPMFGFMAGGVNNDIALELFAAATFLALARAFRRGLTVRRGVAIGLALGLGLVSKWTMLALVPAVAIALAVLVWREWRHRPAARRNALRAAAVTLAVAAAPLALYFALDATVWDRPIYQASADPAPSTAPAAPAPPADTRGTANLRQQITYTWQLFLPRLPFMDDDFRGIQPLWDTWFTGLNGRFGWLDYAFPPAFYTWIWWTVFLPILLLAGWGLWRSRHALRRRLPELAVYLSAVVGLMVVIGRPSYTEWLAKSYPFEQPRYILVLLPLYAAIVALAVRGAGRRLMPVVGTVIVMLALAHTLFAQLLTLTRYYV